MNIPRNGSDIVRRSEEDPKKFVSKLGRQSEWNTGLQPGILAIVYTTQWADLRGRYNAFSTSSWSSILRYKWQQRWRHQLVSNIPRRASTHQFWVRENVATVSPNLSPITFIIIVLIRAYKNKRTRKISITDSSRDRTSCVFFHGSYII